MVPILRRNGHKIVSVGRNHHELADLKKSWSLGDPLPEAGEIDLIFYLVLDYSKIKIAKNFYSANLESLLAMVANPQYKYKLVIPTSHSGKPNAKSRYGQLKQLHKAIAVENNLRTFLVGWLDSPSNGGRVTVRLLELLNRINFNFLPSRGRQKIFLSNITDIEKGLEEIQSNQFNVEAHGEIPITLFQLVYGPRSVYPINFGSLTKIVLKLLPLFYPVLPKGIIRSIDSARSML
jgi:hypothetical protein